MGSLIAVLLAFSIGCVLSGIYITVFYHRAFTHRAVELKPGLRRFVLATGPWVTGMDVRGWSCMHRMHHENTDVPGDPHSPVDSSIVGVFFAQHRSYERVLVKLLKNDERTVNTVPDIPEPLAWTTRHGVWFLPYIVWGIGAVTVGWLLGAWYVGLAFALGLMSHPIQGWMVNSFGHATGKRNFDTPDQSHNSLPVAITVFGEGLQNNHHYAPSSARFRYQWYEPDMGYLFCLGLESVGLLEIRRDTLLKTRRQERRLGAQSADAQTTEERLEVGARR